MTNQAGQLSASQPINWQLSYELFKGQYALTCDLDFPILMKISEETFAAMKEALRLQAAALEREAQTDALVSALELALSHMPDDESLYYGKDSGDLETVKEALRLYRGVG